MNFSQYFAYRPAAVVRARGTDAFTFLQGQFTQDLRSNKLRFCAYGLWLNQKGKVLADSFALKDGEEWLLLSYSSPADTLLKRLETYIIADDVELSDETERWFGTSFLGADAGSWLSQQGLALPVAEEWLPAGEGILFRGRRTHTESWEWLWPAEAAGPAQLSGAEAIDGHALERARIRSGIPCVPADIGPFDLPNEGGLERDAVSFSKGCYLGQEVMARLNNLGQVRRRLVRVSGSGEPPGRVGLVSAEGKRVGELRSCAPQADGQGYVGLALVSVLYLARPEPLFLENSSGSEVTLEKEPS